MEIEPKEKAELIQQLMEKQRAKEAICSSEESHFVGGDDHRRLVLSGLLPQLETLNAEGKLQQPESPVDPKKGKSDITIETGSSCGNECGREEIIRELKKVQKQNFITHCLLSAMIALTVAWQVSEFALVFKVKNGLNNPFKCIASLLTGMAKDPIKNAAQIADEEPSTKQLHPSIPPLKIPELPCFDFPMDLDDGKH